MYLKIHLNPPPIYKEPPAENARKTRNEKTRNREIERVTILLVTLFVFPLVVPFQSLDVVVQAEDGASQEERLGDVHERTIVHIVNVYHLNEG